MKDEEEEKMLPASWQKPPSLAFRLALLVITIGIISFIYSDGFSFVKSTLTEFIKPSFSLELDYESIFLPADGSNSINVNIIAKNKKDQLISGENIGIAIPQGKIDINILPNPPAHISKQITIKATDSPGKAVIDFTLQGQTKTLELEIFDSAPPAIPALISPENNASFPTANPIISGQGPVGTQVEIYVDEQLNTVTDTDESGLFSLPLQKLLSRGKHKIIVKAKNKYGIYSQPTSPIYITIQTHDPEIDIANIRLKPNPVTAGEIFYIFIPVSADTQKVSVIIEDKEWTLEDKYKSSIFSGIIKTPPSPGLYRLSAIITNGAGDSILAENITSVVVQ